MKGFSLSMRIRPTIMLFGDSITEFGFGVEGKQGWASLLSAEYTRRADVLSRGFSGYNTKHALDVLPSIFGNAIGSDESKSSSTVKTELLFCTVFFGANDCSLPSARQHLDIESFDANIRSIVSEIRR
jgi:lysophospholipase L1-like esterase